MTRKPPTLALIASVLLWLGLTAIPATAIRLVTPEPAIDAPIPEEAFARYAGLNTSLTEEGYPMLGDPDAPFIIEDFSSFACPFCRDFHEETFPGVLELIEEGQVAFVYVPIYITGSLPNNQNANLAAICAAEQDTFWPYLDMLYDWHTRFGQTAFIDERLEQGAVNLGLDMQQWQTCLADDAGTQLLEDAVEMMRRRGYGGTPTLVINGERVAATLDAILDFIDGQDGESTHINPSASQI